MANKFSRFSNMLLKAKTEEEVKHAYAENFGLDYDTEFHHDLYSPDIFLNLNSPAASRGGNHAPPFSPR